MIPGQETRVTAYYGKPRASGDDPWGEIKANSTGGVNPARAGMIRQVRFSRFVVGGKPRASGDDPSTSLTPSGRTW